MSRADKITIETNKIEYYSDFMNDFAKNPITGFLAKVTNEESVKQSIRNIIFTNRGERFYNSGFGSTIKSSLFNPLDAITIIAIKESITESINNFEPRANLLEVLVIPNENDNLVNINIVFTIKNISNNPTQVSAVVNRWR